jgi:DNA-binding IclR family transcriptional regulator
MLAVMPEAEVDACIAHNAPRYGYYGLDTDAVRHLVGAARVHGYSLLTGLTIRGVSVVALPVPGSDARLSVGVAGMTARFVPEQLAVIVRRIQERLANAALASSWPPNATE